MTYTEHHPILAGGDIELSNFITGGNTTGDTGMIAARLLLSRIEGYPRSERFLALPTESSTDLGRRFLTTGDCAYIDCSKLEIALRESRSAREWVAAWEAMLGVVRRAQQEVNAEMPRRCRVHVHANNSDGVNSWGSHIDLLCSRREFENIVHLALPAHMLSMASFLASSIIVCGQGHVGARRGMPDVDFQLSQRADHIHRLIGPSTMSPERSFINTRDESHALTTQARLHVIPCDSNRQQVANYLKVGTLQILLAMLEADVVDTSLLLADPLGALAHFSRDPLLEARAETLHGRSMTALEMQTAFAGHAARFVESGACEGIVPEAAQIVALWTEVLQAMRTGSALTTRLDWPLKLALLHRAMDGDRTLTWQSPELRRLDHLFSSLDDQDSLYQTMLRAGATERVVTQQEIDRAASGPPDDTRAYTRGKLLELAEPDEVLSVDWSWLRFRIRGRSYWPTYRSVNLGDPTGFTRADTEAIFATATTLEDALDAFDQNYPPPASAAAYVSPYNDTKGERTYGISRAN